MANVRCYGISSIDQSSRKNNKSSHAEIFCCAHLRWCRNGCTSNVLSCGCTTIKISKMDNTKNLIFSLSYLKLCYFAFLLARFICQKIYYIHLLTSFDYYTRLLKINISIQETKMIACGWCSSHCVITFTYKCSTREAVYTPRFRRVKYATITRNYCTHYL